MTKSRIARQDLEVLRDLIDKYGRAQLKTDVTLREGEKVVVGTSTVQDRGLVVVMSGRVIK